ncbi:alpha-dioxygenase 1-like [Cucumis melo var. makuwa]|uniref:Alpha-dioxygenase 1-like n=1 Tax=Cucumis melo var. makuwa TaxID=1194695 RepID=A0A5A7UHI5_CUCMM|nr:alpha-dioxygenase 1-like [Cucumis melo var. makuwa]
MGVFKGLVLKFIHKDFHEVVRRMSAIDTFLFLIVHFVDKLGVWHKLPVILGLLYLATRRHLHQQYSLFNVGKAPPGGVRFNPKDYPYRTPDGKYNDPFNEDAGAQDTFFGRNIHPVDQSETEVELVAPREVANECPLKSFKFFPTKQVSTGVSDIKTGTINIRTPWWDGSVLYGSNAEMLGKVRTFEDGKLKIDDNGLLPHNTDGVAISGDVRNSWAGVSTLQALFIKEHNAVCDALKMEYKDMEDKDLYRHARLVTSAVIAKIHTIDWTVELLKTDTLLAGMRGNWYGLLGKKFKDVFGHVGGEILGGLVGLKKPNNHGVPYSLTEEFTSVYRMHPLLPEEFYFRDVYDDPDENKSPPLNRKVPMSDMIGHKGEETAKKMGFTALLVSMGHQASGALELFNYPLWLRDLIAQDMDGKDRPDHVDLAALEVYRDRERKVARYNDFRRGLFLIPISKWEDLTDNKEAIEVLREVYGDNVEELDILVGLLAEKKIKGFAISETAFVIFLLMASRRLEADSFFTCYFNEGAYTKRGLEWVNKTESLKDVIERHHPEISKKWMNSSSAFSVWDSPPNKPNKVPIYLRIPR